MSGVRGQNNFFDFSLLILLPIFSVYLRNPQITYKTIQETIFSIIISLAFLILCCLLYKIRLFVEELFYIKSDYNGDIWSVMKATLCFNTPSLIVIGITIFSFLMIIVHLNHHSFPQMILSHPYSMFFDLAFSLLLLYLIDILECRSTIVSKIFLSGGLDPGTSIACSYFYGYLKIVLPASGGNERAGILTSFEKYEANNGIKMPVKKLFILIPSSSYIPPDLREASDNWLEHSGDLESVVLNRAGVIQRSYKNSVYRLRTEAPSINNASAKFFYLAAEGATPLKTFLEVQHMSHRYAPTYREFKKEIIKSFYTTLQNLLTDNPDCRDYCELVYYEDDIERVNPAHVLLERIQQLSQS